MKKWLKKIAKGNKGFGLNELIGIAAAMIVAAFIVIPGLTSLGRNAITRMQDWWRSVAATIFIDDIGDVQDPPN
jgi:cell division protein FtsX